MRFKDKVAIVTGGGRDIGRSISIRLASEGTPDEVAAAVAFLASEDASFLAGVNLDINGGLFFS